MNTQQHNVIEALYLQLYDRMMAYARSSLRSESQAEEVVQETFRIACTKPEVLCASANPQGWLLLTLKHTIRNRLRSKETALRLMTEYLASQGMDAAFSEDALPLELLYGPLAQSEEFRLLREMAVEGKSHLEMAQARGISLNACKKRVQRAKEYLKRKIQK